MKYAHGWMMTLVTGLASLCAVAVGCQFDDDGDYVEIEQEEDIVGDYEPYEQEPMLGEQEPMMGHESIEVEQGVEPIRPEDRYIDRGDDPFVEPDASDPFYDVPHVPE